MTPAAAAAATAAGGRQVAALAAMSGDAVATAGLAGAEGGGEGTMVVYVTVPNMEVGEVFC